MQRPPEEDYWRSRLSRTLRQVASEETLYNPLPGDSYRRIRLHGSSINVILYLHIRIFRGRYTRDSEIQKLVNDR